MHLNYIPSMPHFRYIAVVRPNIPGLQQSIEDAEAEQSFAERVADLLAQRAVRNEPPRVTTLSDMIVKLRRELDKARATQEASDGPVEHADGSASFEAPEPEAASIAPELLDTVPEPARAAPPRILQENAVPMSKGDAITLHTIRMRARELWTLIDQGLADGREKALAKTKLEESVLWASQAV